MKFPAQPFQLTAGSSRHLTEIPGGKEVNPAKSNRCRSYGSDYRKKRPIPRSNTFGVAGRDQRIGHISLPRLSNFSSSPETTRQVRTRYLPNLLKEWRKSQVEAGVAMKGPNCRRTPISVLTREPLSSAKRYAGNRGGFQVEPPTRPASA